MGKLSKKNLDLSVWIVILKELTKINQDLEYLAHIIEGGPDPFSEREKDIEIFITKLTHKKKRPLSTHEAIRIREIVEKLYRDFELTPEYLLLEKDCLYFPTWVESTPIFIRLKLY